MDINPTAWPKAFGEVLRTVRFLPPSLFLSLSFILRDAAATADIVISWAKMSICVCLECISAMPAAWRGWQRAQIASHATQSSDILGRRPVKKAT